mmetsp:Transcript_30126/g.48364  ORF Transcript_30126/g.48364 Transcript_30126/m.48364 type:complete len:103 (-) Transcript_30126:1044-1352(-)
MTHIDPIVFLESCCNCAVDTTITTTTTTTTATSTTSYHIDVTNINRAKLLMHTQHLGSSWHEENLRDIEGLTAAAWRVVDSAEGWENDDDDDDDGHTPRPSP